MHEYICASGEHTKLKLCCFDTDSSLVLALQGIICFTFSVPCFLRSVFSVEESLGCGFRCVGLIAS